jgi:glycosyltransferase involved in cell wall biosynthesis
MASADAFLSMGPCDTFSLVTLEALCCETPVAACVEAAASELVRGAGGTSSYGPWNSPRALFESSLAAMAEPEEKRRGFRRFAEKYTWDACFEGIFAVYREVTG